MLMMLTQAECFLHVKMASFMHPEHVVSVL